MENVAYTWRSYWRWEWRMEGLRFILRSIALLTVTKLTVERFKLASPSLRRYYFGRFYFHPQNVWFHSHFLFGPWAPSNVLLFGLWRPSIILKMPYSTPKYKVICLYSVLKDRITCHYSMFDDWMKDGSEIKYIWGYK